MIKPIWETMGQEFYNKHRPIFANAKAANLAICGGMAFALYKNDREYRPHDLDFVGTRRNASKFLECLTFWLSGRSVKYGLMCNANNDFCIPPAVVHYRIVVPFWLPICVFGVPEERLRTFRIKGGHQVQYLQDIHAAARIVQERDGQPRRAANPLELNIAPQPIQP